MNDDTPMTPSDDDVEDINDDDNHDDVVDINDDDNHDDIGWTIREKYTSPEEIQKYIHLLLAVNRPQNDNCSEEEEEEKKVDKFMYSTNQINIHFNQFIQKIKSVKDDDTIFCNNDDDAINKLLRLALTALLISTQTKTVTTDAIHELMQIRNEYIAINYRIRNEGNDTNGTCTGSNNNCCMNAIINAPLCEYHQQFKTIAQKLLHGLLDATDYYDSPFLSISHVIIYMILSKEIYFMMNEDAIGEMFLNNIYNKQCRYNKYFLIAIVHNKYIFPTHFTSKHANKYDKLSSKYELYQNNDCNMNKIRNIDKDMLYYSKNNLQCFFTALLIMNKYTEWAHKYMDNMDNIYDGYKKIWTEFMNPNFVDNCDIHNIKTVKQYKDWISCKSISYFFGALNDDWNDDDNLGWQKK